MQPEAAKRQRQRQRQQQTVAADIRRQQEQAICRQAPLGLILMEYVAWLHSVFLSTWSASGASTRKKLHIDAYIARLSMASCWSVRLTCGMLT